MSSPLGTELKRSKYRLLGLVGQGQFGRVFCAAHRQTGRLVALKNLEHQRFPTHKFLRELRFLLSLQHPNIVTCHALEHTRTGRYLVMDYCEGGTLRSLMEEDRRLSVAQSLKLVADILSGLEHAHSRGIVHCDIKPENILLSVQPTGWTARISDFGIARLSQEMVDQDEMGNTGSPAYMAPERFYGQYSLSSDLYSVGILLFELLTGHRPFSGTPAELMSAHLNQPLKLPDSIAETWHPLLITSLQKLAARRFRSATDMLAALRTASALEGLGWWQDSKLISLPLLKPTVGLIAHPFTSQRQELLTHRVNCLAIAPHINNSASHSQSAHTTALYLAAGTQLSLRLGMEKAPSNVTQPDIGSESFEANQVANLSSPIQELLIRPQGCFVVTQNSVCLAPLNSELEAETLSIRLTAEFKQGSFAAVEAGGRWLAIATPVSTETSSLSFVKTKTRGATVQVASNPIVLSNTSQPNNLMGLIALDSSHIAVISALEAGKTQQKVARSYGATLFEIFARRGDRLGALTANLCIKHIQPTLTPYRLMATDEYNPQSLVLIDLKPFRVSRLAVEISPQFLVATNWGYIAANTQGHIVLLDSYGQQINRIDGPEHLTAIASFNSYGLLMTTWNGNQGKLYTVDLRDLNVDLLF